MKKLYTLLVLVLAVVTSNAQIVNIPDANFKARLLAASTSNSTATNAAGASIKIDINNDSNIQVSEALLVYGLSLYSTTIVDLTGIESFTNLKMLSCGSTSSSPLTVLSVNTLANLESLTVRNSQLSAINLSNNINLTYLNCSDNQFASLDLSTLTDLETLDCSSNLFATINISSNINLKYLYCGGNPLTTINVNNNILLEEISAGLCQLTSIDVSPLINLDVLALHNNPTLTSINVDSNIDLKDLLIYGCTQIETLNVSNNVLLEKLYFQDTNISAIDVSNNINLQHLVFHDAPVASLDVTNNVNLLALAFSNTTIANLDLSNNLLLQYLVIPNNPITSLSLINNVNLTSADLRNLQVTSLDLSNNSLITNLSIYNNPLLIEVNLKNGYIITATNFSVSGCPNLQYICADDAEIVLLQTLITNAGYTNCHVNTYCTFEPGGTFYTIEGNHRWDTTNNGCDTNDFLFPNMKFNISNGTTTTTLISSNEGSYSYDVPAGTYSVTPVLENPSYFLVTPSNTGSIVFPTAVNPFVRDFCIRSVASNPDLEVAIYPQTNARPGFDNRFMVFYKNKGGIPQNGSVGFTYNDAIQDLVSTSLAPSTATSGNLTWNFTNLLPFETRSVTVRFNLNTPTETPALNGGDVLNYGATITGNLTDILPSDNTSNATQTAVNSYDPNDKTCVEGTSITPSMVGQYVHYVIRFENTGTANAVNIVVRDLIDTAKFDIASLIPQTGSHPFVTRIINTNQVEFIFENINLPFDDANNDGYVAFKIKTKPTLVVGDTFSNSANIYFDYNFPIVTDTYTTTVQALGNQDFEFNSVFSLSPVPTKDVLTITANESVVMSSVNIYNTLGQLVQVNTNPSETIDVSGLSSGSYFIKIISDKGSATGKFIKE